MFTEPGRTVLMPRRGERFLGAPHRARTRIRERRRRVFTALVEGVAFTGLIGLFPPLRRMWMVTGILAVLLVAFVWMLLQLRAQETARRGGTAPAPPQAPLFTQPSFPVVEEGGRRIVVVPDPDRPRSRVAG